MVATRRRNRLARDVQRAPIAAKLAAEAPFCGGEVKADESHFSSVHAGKRGHSAAGKVPVLGLLKQFGKVYATMIPDSRRKRWSASFASVFSQMASSARIAVGMWIIG